MEKSPSNKAVHVRVARKIRQLRRQKGWSQEKLAFEADSRPLLLNKILNIGFL